MNGLGYRKICIYHVTLFPSLVIDMFSGTRSLELLLCHVRSMYLANASGDGKVLGCIQLCYKERVSLQLMIL